jgi:mycothiol synthase
MTPRLRQFQPNDLGALAALITAIDGAGPQPRRVTAEELDEEFDGVHTDPARDVIVAERDDTLVAYGYVMLLAGSDRHRCYLWGGVHPTSRHQGLGTQLLANLTAMGQRRLDELTDDAPRLLHAYAPVDDTVLTALFQRNGWRIVRYFDDLHRATTPTPVADCPSGITIVPWDDGRSAELRDVKNTAFADHWGSQPSTEHEWQQLTHGGAARRDLSRIALDDHHHVVGLCLAHRHASDDEVLGTRYAWIDKVATTPTHRGRGIAAALICATIDTMANDGIERVALGVDSDNPTGAHRLYANLGFTPWARYATWERPASARQPVAN